MVALTRWLKENHVEQVECLISDINGRAMGKIIPTHKFICEEVRLAESLLVQPLVGDIDARYHEIIDPREGDMLLAPDETSVRLVPWVSNTTAQVLHDCNNLDGSPHGLSSRNVLKRVLDLYSAQGWRPVLAPEIEFYLVKQNIDPKNEIEPPVGRSGRPEISSGAFYVDALAEFRSFTDEMQECCRQQKLDVDTLVHEWGRGQFEVNFLHGDALNLADQVFCFKRLVREVALRHGVYATFMAKPMASEPGSAMHIHQSIVEKASGQNIFVDQFGNESELFFHFIGGLQKYTPNVVSFYAPNVNSYRRFAKGMLAPINLQWGHDNRTVGIRIPRSDSGAKRIENRFPGVDANPYLAIAASLGCGYLGMQNSVGATSAHKGDTGHGTINFPHNIDQALTMLGECAELEDVFGKGFIAAYTAVKSAEKDSFSRVVTAWERQHLLLGV